MASCHEALLNSFMSSLFERDTLPVQSTSIASLCFSLKPFFFFFLVILLFCPLPQFAVEYLSIFRGQTEQAWSGKLENSAVWLKPPLSYLAWHCNICKHWLHWQNSSGFCSVIPVFFLMVAFCRNGFFSVYL